MTQPNSPASYVQGVPLFLASDIAAVQYFKDHDAEIDALSGELVLLVPEEVRLNNSTGLIEAVRSEGADGKRFPGLKLQHLPCLWIEDNAGATSIIQLPDDFRDIKQFMRILGDAVAQTKSAPELAKMVINMADAGAAARNPFLRVLLGEANLKKSTERLLALIFGVIFVSVILAIAVLNPNPTGFQYTIFRIVLAVAAGGFVSMTPGFIDVTIGNWLRAGGALAVFAIVYFFAPAAIESTTRAPADVSPPAAQSPAAAKK